MQDEIRIEVTIQLLHSPNSTGPAFLAELRQQLPNLLTLLSYEFQATDDLATLDNSELSNSLLVFNMEVFPLGEELIVTYVAGIDLESEGNITDDITLHYRTIKQEGIGLQVML